MRALVLVLLLSLGSANLFWAQPEKAGWWRRPLFLGETYPRLPTGELRDFANTYFALLNRCHVPRIMELFAHDYSGWEADGDPVDRARQHVAIGYFCLPPAKGGFNGTRFTPLEVQQVGPDAIYLRVNIANHNFSAPFNFSQSLLLARNVLTGRYQIRMEVQSLSGVRLRTAVGQKPTPGRVALKPVTN